MKRRPQRRRLPRRRQRLPQPRRPHPPQSRPPRRRPLKKTVVVNKPAVKATARRPRRGNAAPEAQPRKGLINCSSSPWASACPTLGRERRDCKRFPRAQGSSSRRVRSRRAAPRPWRPLYAAAEREASNPPSRSARGGGAGRLRHQPDHQGTGQAPQGWQLAGDGSESPGHRQARRARPAFTRRARVHTPVGPQ